MYEKKWIFKKLIIETYIFKLHIFYKILTIAKS